MNETEVAPASNGNGELRQLADDARWARLRDRLFVIVAVLAILVQLGTAAVVIQTQRELAAIRTRQLQIVQLQNDAQLCLQHDVILSLKVGLGSLSRALGLHPATRQLREIQVPNVEELRCEELAADLAELLPDVGAGPR